MYGNLTTGLLAGGRPVPKDVGENAPALDMPAREERLLAARLGAYTLPPYMLVRLLE